MVSRILSPNSPIRQRHTAYSIMIMSYHMSDVASPVVDAIACLRILLLVSNSSSKKAHFLQTDE